MNDSILPRVDKKRLVVFSDDWGRHPSSSQYLIQCVLSEYNVEWINTIGMRPPKVSLSTFTRGVQKIGDWSRKTRKSPVSAPEGCRNPAVYNPIMWPRFRWNWQRSVNANLMRRQLQHCRGIEFGITTVPIVADVLPDLGVGHWTYYCVDDWSTWVGLDHRTLDRLEAKLLPQVDSIVTASEALQSRIERKGFESTVLTHGVHLDHWHTPRESVALLDDLERPLVVQWGLINQNLDVAALSRLSSEITEGTILLVGPEVDVDPALDQVDRVVRFPPMEYSELPSLARAASVLIMAYQANTATKASQPLKLKEYMSTDLPVVATKIPASEAWADAVDLYESPEQFSQLVRQRISEGSSDVQMNARKRLKSESWANKADQFMDIVTASQRIVGTGNSGVGSC